MNTIIEDSPELKRRTIAWSLINSYKYHCNETGFNEWKENTPQYVKDLETKLFNTQNGWSKF